MSIADKFEIHQRTISFRHGRNQLVGTLFVPSVSDLCPGLVMLQGSGPMDRDNDGYFLPIREQILQRGIAVLCYDRPGVNDSTGHWDVMTDHDRAHEALEALDCLCSQDEIDCDRVGLWGHSQGGWVAPLAALFSQDVAFVAISSGPGISPAEQNIHATRQQMLRDGFTPVVVQHAEAFVRALMEAARRGEVFKRVEETLIRPVRNEPWYRYCDFVDATTWHTFAAGKPRSSSGFDYDPIPALRQVQCPFLAVFGDEDVLVPARQSADIVEQALLEAGNERMTIKIFPRADHRLYDVGSGDFSTGYLEFLASWLAEATATN